MALAAKARTYPCIRADEGGREMRASGNDDPHHGSDWVLNGAISGTCTPRNGEAESSLSPSYDALAADAATTYGRETCR